mgnify:CR=1 FL=1
MVLSGAAHSASGLHVKSQNLPATLNSTGRDCSESIESAQPPGADYIPGRNVAGNSVAPADIGRNEPDIYPVIRFDLGLGKRQKNRYFSPGLKGGPLRAKDLTAGEVSIDTFNGEVALDGQPLAFKKNRYDC